MQIRVWVTWARLSWGSDTELEENSEWFQAEYQLDGSSQESKDCRPALET